MSPSSIAILGGGLSGLSSAFHLSRRFPTVPITILEKSSHFGGWVRSERVEVRDNAGNSAKVLLEAGPRTLRPNGKSVLELINLLGVESSLLTVPRTSPAARKRFLHIPGSKGLTVVPTSLSAMLTSPLARILIPAVMKEPLRSRSNRQELAEEDQSMDAFLTAHFGPDFARTMGSALVHGIYAADSRMLSVRAAFPMLWDAAKEGKGSVVRGFARKAFASSGAVEDPHYELGETPTMMKGTSVYSFRDGVETVARELERYLRTRVNISVVMGDAIASIQASASGEFTVSTRTGRHFQSSHIVSALPLKALSEVISDVPTSPTPVMSQLSSTPTSSVTVVNIVFPPTPFPIHPPGFGYLVPRPSDDATQDEISDHASVLGTVFDSCALPEQDEYAGAGSPRFTKVTMMLGGPHPFSHTAPSVAVDKLLRILTRHLAPPRPLPDPVLVRARHLTGCIPTPAVGHLQRVAALKDELQIDGKWQGRLEIVGAGVGGVSVPDCIEQGRHVGSAW